MYGCYRTHQGHGEKPQQPGAYVYKFHHDNPTATLTKIVSDMVM
jgi:hypothetical protein